MKVLSQATKDWAETKELPQELPALHKKDLVQDSLDWEKAKDEVEKRAGIRPYCLFCRTDSHAEAHCVAARIRHASKRKSSDGEDSKPGNVTIRKKKNFKEFRRDLEQVVVKGRNTDDVQYMKEADSYSHLFACYLLSAFGTFTEGQMSASHCMAGNKEILQ